MDKVKFGCGKKREETKKKNDGASSKMRQPKDSQEATDEELLMHWKRYTRPLPKEFPKIN